MFSALSIRARRQRAELGSAGRSSVAEDWSSGSGGSYGCGLDADLLRTCARGATRGAAADGRDSGIVVGAAAAISGLAVETVASGLFGGGWADFPAAILVAEGSRNASALVSLYGASRAEIECDHGTPH